VPLDRQRQIIRPHAGTVVGHADVSAAAIAENDIDARGTGVYGVLDKFLNNARGPLDHLARRNAIDRRLGKPPDAHRPSPRTEAEQDRLFLEFQPIRQTPG
jgi:hypothetical protein